MKTSATALRKRSARPYEQIVIEGVKPAIDHGRFPVKALVGETCTVDATVFRHGHERIRAAVRVRRPKAAGVREFPMLLVDPARDLWRAEILLDTAGKFTLSIAAWTDQFATWVSDLEMRVEAGASDVAGEIPEAIALVERAAGSAKGEVKKEIVALLQRLRDASGDPSRFRVLAADSATLDLVGRNALRDDEVRYESDFEIKAERPLARAGAWYEVRASLSGAADMAGGLAEAQRSLAVIHERGFDVVHVAPAMPFGFETEANIGELDQFVHATNVLGLEVALALSTECSADHPWVTQHPDWFHRRVDGSIRLNFETTDWKRLWHALREVFRFWIGHGIRIFSAVDPHTKPLGFWSWVIDEIHLESPEVIFLAESVPRAPIARALGLRGFTQSRTHFEQQRTKSELTSYLRELLSPHLTAAVRPNFSARGGDPAFRSRVVLAATLSPSYSVSEAPDDAHDLIRRLNEARKANPALLRFDNLQLAETDDEHLVAFVKSTPDHSNSVIVVVNLDPGQAHAGHVRAPEAAIGLAPEESATVEDVLTGKTYTWSRSMHVRLDPHDGAPAHVLVVRGR
jgi:starch synthase (maltosyl-transferring)